MTIVILKTELYDYQKAGFEKLCRLKVGALYMEMGTGKTRTALELIQRRLEKQRIKQVLWLCPCSVKVNLEIDLDKHADGWRDAIRISGIESLSGSARLYAEHLQYVAQAPTMLIVDESNLVKNSRAIRSRRIISVAEQCPYRLILNGTPISKNEADLYGQWYLLDWRILGYQSFWTFAANHLEYDARYTHRVRRVLNVDYLTAKIAPYSYIVRKDDVLKLPGKSTSCCSFSLTPEQAEHYLEVRDAFLMELVADEERNGGEPSSAAIYRTFTALQDVCSGRRIITPAWKSIRHEPFFADPHDNPRVQQLLRLLKGIEGKVVIWCKYQHEIDDVADVLTAQYGADNICVFCGKINQKKRQEALRQFAKSARFLIANKTCAGYGLNLQYAYQAIYYNNDWDWATRAQSEDRLHRIGQTHDVMLTDIYARGTIDARILHCLDTKESLVQQFKKSVKSKNAAAWIDGVDLEGLHDSVGTGG